MVEKSEANASAALCFLLGLGLGSLLTVLFTPQSGRETRGSVVQKAREAKEYARRKARDVQGRAERLVEQGKKAVREKTQRVSAAADAGREAYKRELAKEKVPGMD